MLVPKLAHWIQQMKDSLSLVNRLGRRSCARGRGCSQRSRVFNFSWLCWDWKKLVICDLLKLIFLFVIYCFKNDKLSLKLLLDCWAASLTRFSMLFGRREEGLSAHESCNVLGSPQGAATQRGKGERSRESPEHVCTWCSSRVGLQHLLKADAVSRCSESRSEQTAFHWEDQIKQSPHL